MTATILRMQIPGPRPTTLTRTLTGHHTQGRAPGGALGRMQSISAARAYIRVMARHNPLSDSCGRDDAWQQVEDLIGLVPQVATGVAELDRLAHLLRETVSRRGMQPFVRAVIDLKACTVEVVAAGNVLRLRLHAPGTTRIITTRLTPCGAARVDDDTIRT